MIMEEVQCSEIFGCVALVYYTHTHMMICNVYVLYMYAKRFSVYMMNTSFPGLSSGCNTGAGVVNRVVFRNVLARGKKITSNYKVKHVLVLKNNFYNKINLHVKNKMTIKQI